MKKLIAAILITLMGCSAREESESVQVPKDSVTVDNPKVVLLYQTRTCSYYKFDNSPSVDIYFCECLYNFSCCI